MSLFVGSAIDGAAFGSVIGLLAMSLVVIYRSTRVLSFAQGAIASLATYVYFQLQTVWGWPVLVALPLSLVAAAGIGAASERATMHPLRRADALTRTVATLGLVLVLQVVMRTLWGGEESFVRGLTTSRVGAGIVSIGLQEVVTVALALGAALGLAAWLRSSYGGLALSALANDARAARLLGVDPARASMLAWAIAAVLAALAGILVTPTLVLNPMQMTLIMVASFGAALLGGFEHLGRALAGGVLIGMVQGVTVAFVSAPGLDETFGFIAVFVVLLAARGRRGGALLARGAEL